MLCQQPECLGEEDANVFHFLVVLYSSSSSRSYPLIHLQRLRCKRTEEKREDGRRAVRPRKADRLGMMGGGGGGQKAMAEAGVKALKKSHPQNKCICRYMYYYICSPDVL